jgi:hypothetical protein
MKRATPKSGGVPGRANPTARRTRQPAPTLTTKGMLSYRFLEDIQQTKYQAAQKHRRPEVEAFIQDVFMVEVKGNHGKTNSTHKSSNCQAYFVFSVHT